MVIEPERQKGMTLWLTGLSGSGKTSIATELAAMLSEGQIPHTIFDGDVVRSGPNSDLGYDGWSRGENARRIGEMSLGASLAGMIAIAAVISPYTRHRSAVRQNHEIARVPFAEIYIEAPLEICEHRDPKGLYAKARSGSIPNFTGIDSPYEIPTAPEFVCNTVKKSIVDSAREIVEHFAILEKAHLK